MPCVALGSPSAASVGPPLSDLRRPRHARPWRTATRRRTAHPMEPFYPLHALRLRPLLPGAARGVRDAEQIFSEYAYFSSFSTSWLEHAARYIEQMIAAASAGRPATSSSSPATTATCSSTSWRAASPCWGSSRPPTSPKVASRRACPRSSSSSAAHWPVADCRWHAPTCSSPTTSWRTSPTSTISSTASRSCWRRRRDHDGIPAPAAAGRAASSWTRSITSISPTSRFLTAARVFAAHGSPFRRRRAADARRLAADYGPHDDDAAKPESARARELREPEREAGSSELESYADFAAEVETTSGLLSFLIDGKNAGKAVVG